MTDRPDARELIEIARTVLATELLPLLPAEKRLTGLMVANALAVAGRELAAPATAEPAVNIAALRAGNHDSDLTLYRALLEAARARTRSRRW